MNHKKNATQKKSPAPALDRGLKIINLLLTGPSPVSFKQICTHLEVANTTATRLLTVLCEQSFVEKDEQGLYKIGPNLRAHLSTTPTRQRLRNTAPTQLTDLMQQSGNTAAIFYYNGNTVEMLCKRMHPNALVMQEEGCKNTPPVIYPSPWSLLFSHEQTDDLKKMSHNTPHNYVESELERLQHEGFCMDPLEHPEHWRRLATPIRDHSDNIVAALVLGGNPYTIPQDKIEQLARLLKAKAAFFTQQLNQSSFS